ncbi:MAG: protein-L-isoaspartate(D-aspartate) O-methyltransferase [Candidatus Aminicenantia bacterium]
MKKEREWEKKRMEMVMEQVVKRGIRDEGVLNAMKKVPRHLFVPEEYRIHSYEDHPLPIGEEQTISQPYIVAYMTELLELDKKVRVLEIGTGSGYQSAILAEICGEVYTVELIETLLLRAQQTLSSLGYKNIRFLVGDGTYGWGKFSPYDRIIVTAASPRVPPALIEQLSDNGILVIPIGTYSQEIVRIRKKGKKIDEETLIPVRFVPLITVQ